MRRRRTMMNVKLDPKDQKMIAELKVSIQKLIAALNQLSKK